MFKLSTTNTHDASGSVATVWATCWTKSASVVRRHRLARADKCTFPVGPRLGATRVPVTT